MKKWKIAQRRMAWQVLSSTGDRNIAGHTAKIPEGFQFIEGDGPRGLGIDFSDSGKISELAHAIIPQITISKRDKLCNELEGVWREVHGRHIPNELLPDNTSELSMNKGQTAGLTAFFEAMAVPQTSILGLLKGADSSLHDEGSESAKGSDEEEEVQEEGVQEEPSTRRSLKQGLTKSSSAKEFTSHTKSNTSPLPAKKAGHPLKKKERAQTPDSGFNSDCSNPDLEDLAQRKGSLDSARIMNNPLLSNFIKLKRVEEPRRRYSVQHEGDVRTNKGDEGLSTVPEHALLSLHEQKSSSSLKSDTSHNQRKVKTVVKTNYICNTLARNVLPVAETYHIANGHHKDTYQTFTRRRTKGLMYNTLDPTTKSDYYSHTNSKRITSRGK